MCGRYAAVLSGVKVKLTLERRNNLTEGEPVRMSRQFQTQSPETAEKRKIVGHQLPGYYARGSLDRDLSTRRCPVSLERRL